MLAGNIDCLMKLWRMSLTGQSPPFTDHNDLYSRIDAIPYGSHDWECFKVGYQGDAVEGEPCAPFMDANYEVWHRNAFHVMADMIVNRDFDGEFDYSPYQEYYGDEHRFQNFMSGNWAWRQAVRVSCILSVPHLIPTHRTPFTPRIQKLPRVQCSFRLSSVATRQQCQWQLEIMNITPFIYLLGIYTTKPAGHEGVV